MIKQKLRSIGIASPGNILLAFDLAQAESWVVAHLAEETEMKKALYGEGIHLKTARLIFENPTLSKENAGEYYLGKQTNHATSYGEGDETMAKNINKKSDEPPFITVSIRQCKKYQTKWHNYYKNIRGLWWQEIQETLRRDSRVLITPYKRERTFYAEWGNKLFQEAYAFIPQSTVADHFNGMIQDEVGMAGGLLEIDRLLLSKSEDIKIINQSHDSCMIDCPLPVASEVTEIVFTCLNRPIVIKGESFIIPVDGEIGERWGEMEKLPKWKKAS